MESILQELLLKAEAGDVQAQCDLGKRYAEGKIVEQDYQTAVHWFKVASENGSSMATACLGVMYERGDGVEADIRKAIECYQLAVYDNDPTGMYNLAQCYYYGKGIIKENKKRGLYYMVEAAEAGFVHAMKFLATVYYEEEKFADCVYWAEQAAKFGDVQAQAYIGKCYYDGFCVDMDKSKAFAWFMKAAEQGDVYAMTEVATYYAEGTVCEVNAKEAFKWFKKAAASESYATALSCLALCYELGIGTEVDLKEAKRLEKLAEDLQNKDVVND